MAVVQPQQFDAAATNRLVWILNSDPERDYTEEYKDLTITVPKYLGKVPKHVKDGGNLMEWLSARRFLGQPIQQSQKTPHGEVIHMGKPLRVVELTDEERAELENPKEFKKSVKEVERAAETTCTLCTEPKTFATVQGLTAHLKKDHSNRKPIE